MKKQISFRLAHLKNVAYRNANKAAVAVGLAASAAAARAEGPDVTAVVTAINGASAPIATIGGAVLVVLVGIKVYKWVRRAM